MNVRSRGLITAIAFALPLSLAACGSSDTSAAEAPTASASMSAPETTDAPSDASAVVFGSGCAAVPKDGKGSFNGMATDPVATAASNNPLLTTLVTAVGAAGLGDTLNTTPDITVFAPVDSAFAKLPPAALKAALADPKGSLTKILTNHVVKGKISPDMLADELEKLRQPAEIFITHLKPGEYEVIMEEIQACAGKFAPQMLLTFQQFEF